MLRGIIFLTSLGCPVTVITAQNIGTALQSRFNKLPAICNEQTACLYDQAIDLYIVNQFK